MGMVAPPQGIASAFFVYFGVYGDVTRQALERDVSRQKLYREAAQTATLLEGTTQRAQVESLQKQVQQLQQRVASHETDLSQAVVIDDDRMARIAGIDRGEGSCGACRGVASPCGVIGRRRYIRANVARGTAGVWRDSVQGRRGRKYHDQSGAAHFPQHLACEQPGGRDQ